nr:hypothetical protein HUO10_005371 [Paraburkholderia busanensis]
METTKAEGTLQEAVGGAQRAAGDLLGDAATQISGSARELGGKAQQLYADFAEVVRESTSERPFAALAIAAAAGFVLGAIHASTRARPGGRNADWQDRR